MMPAEICTRMNIEMAEDNEQGMFITMFIGLLDLQTGHLDFSNAGHNAPVTGGGEHDGDFLDMESNAPIGLWPNLEYVGEEIDSIKGRVLFIYTDGLNEAENTDQQQFGDNRLLDFLRQTHFTSAQQVIETLADAVNQHRNGAEPNDDLTMMCIKLS
jgi:serine phosphatase RsbU (regulator of sigma subunit)